MLPVHLPSCFQLPSAPTELSLRLFQAVPVLPNGAAGHFPGLPSELAEGNSSELVTLEEQVVTPLCPSQAHCPPMGQPSFLLPAAAPAS